MSSVAVFAAVCVAVVGFVVGLIARARRVNFEQVAELPRPSDEAGRLMDSGQKFEAIRLYREQTGTTLQQAHRVIEHYSRRSMR